jgi:anti-sigma factor RsiW
MKKLKCRDYRELIMAKTDGEISAEELSLLEAHIKGCADCADYEKDLIKMAQITSSMKVEAPLYLETRVMEAIKTAPAVHGFGLGRGLAFALSFTAVLCAAVFIIYDKSDIQKKDMAVIKQDVHAAQIPETVKAHKYLKPVVNIARSQAKTINKEVAVNEIVNKKVVSPETGVKETAVKEVIASKPEEKAPASAPYMQVPAYTPAAVPANNAVTISKNNDKTTISGAVSAARVSAAEVSKIETPTTVAIPLLESEKAIVANNLINPDRGEAAHIVINVEQQSECKIVIYDKSIRVVSVILNGSKAPGKYEAYWYGKNDNGQKVTEGIYFVYIQIGTRVIKKNIIVTKK